MNKVLLSILFLSFALTAAAQSPDKVAQRLIVKEVTVAATVGEVWKVWTEAHK